MTARLLRGVLAPALGRGSHPHPPHQKAAALGRRPTLSPGLSLAPHDPAPAHGSPSGVCSPALVWFRADLRTRDHAPLRAALTSPRVSSVLPVFVFDPREYPGVAGVTKQPSSNPALIPKAGPRRAALVLGAVRALRLRLRALGSDLVVRVGAPERVLPQLAAACGASRVYSHRESGPHDAAVERAVERALGTAGCELRAGGKDRAAWGAAGALLHPSDLPAELRQSNSAKAGSAQPAPTTAFGEFCQRVSAVRVRDPLPAPPRLKSLPQPRLPAAAASSSSSLDPGPIPSMRDLGFVDADSAAQATTSGGEDEALRQLRAFAAELKKQRPELQQQQGPSDVRGRPPGSADAAAAAAAATSAFGARLSPWLAVGCLSPREVFAELADDGDKASNKGKSKGRCAVVGSGGNGRAGAPASSAPRSDAWLASELLLRDFFGMLNAWRSSSRTPRVDAAAAALPASASAAVATPLPTPAFA